MKYFLKEFTEPIAYFIYCIILFATYAARRWVVYKTLGFYYGLAAALLFAATAQNSFGIDNNWNYNVLYLTTICASSYYYYSLYRSVPKQRFVIVCCVLNLLAFFYFNVIAGQFQAYYHNYAYAFVFLSIVAYSLLYFQELLLNVNEESILSKFDFWLVSANLFYFLGAFLVILFYAYADASIRSSVWILQSIILFISSLIALNGYVVVARQKQQP